MQWPRLLRPLIKQYGEQSVNEASRIVLHYPAELIDNSIEIKRLQVYFGAKHAKLQ